MALKSAGEKEVNELKKLEDIDIPSPSDGEVLQYNAASKKWVAATGGGGGAHHLTHEDGGNDEINVAGLSGELADPQPPKSHKTSHATGGGDALSPADIGAIADPATPADSDILYYQNGAWHRLAKGTEGHYLKQLANIPGWAAVAGGGDLSLTRYWKIGRYHKSAFVSYYAITSGFTIAANYLYAIPFPIPIQMTFDRIAIYIETTATGNMRLGIYDDGAYPDSLVLDAGTVSTGTSGLKEITIDQTLDAGLYWLVLLADAAPAVNYTTNHWGTPIGSRISGPGRHYDAHWKVSQTYGVLPATFPAGGTSHPELLGLILRRSA